MELESRLYKHENQSATSDRGPGALREEAVGVVQIMLVEIDHLFFHTSIDV